MCALFQHVHSFAHMGALATKSCSPHPFISNIQGHTLLKNESVQSAPGFPWCTHIHHSVVGLTETFAPRAMNPSYLEVGVPDNFTKNFRVSLKK